MEISFKEKRVLVTGVSRGIGRDIVKSLVKCGAAVVAVSRPSVHLDSLKAEVPSIEIVAVDLNDWTSTRKALADVQPVDLLVNNAGLAILEPLSDITEDHVDQLLSINVKAVISLTQWVAQTLIARKRPGAIVTVSSQASMVGLLDHAVYCATKGAVDAFTRAAALELGPHNIRVNCINPTVIMTDMGKLGWSDPARADPMIQKIPLRRFGEVQECVDAILFLLSDKASLITGECLRVDGGYVAA